MNILILEDDQIRIDWFFEYFAGENISVTSKPETAIQLLNTIEFDRIYLDHDLLEWHYFEDATCDKTTGLAVAKFLAKSGNQKNARIFIHSLNINGANRMKDALEQANRYCLLTPIDKLSNNKIKR
jgi:CheY-like chemotaxis protein